jgi:5-methylcytosine-specific restriction endonuclease McrA
MAKTRELQSFYASKPWKQAKEYKLFTAEGRCEKCNGIGEIVHHIKPLTEITLNDIDIALGQDNLQLVCRKCHQDIHDRLDGKKPSRKIKFDSNGQIIPF